MDVDPKAVIDNLTRAADAARALLEKLNAQYATDTDQTVTPSPQEDGGKKDYDVADAGPSFLPCSIKFLPRSLAIDAAATARAINPQNAPFLAGPMAAMGLQVDTILDPLHIAALTTKYWGNKPRKLTVSFQEPTPADLRDRIISHMNAWSKRCCISFTWTQGTGDVRISRGQGGYWSYLGSDILHIPRNQQTMNLQGFTMNTPESEYKRVVRHETGHTLGFPHEHMRKELVALLDSQKTTQWFARYQGWSAQIVQEQVLTPLDDRQIMGTPADQDSIMCYQLPGEITKNGQPIHGGADINASDYAFAAKIYPKPGDEGTGDGGDLDWLV